MVMGWSVEFLIDNHFLWPSAHKANYCMQLLVPVAGNHVIDGEHQSCQH